MLWTCLCVSMKKKTSFESFGVSQNLVIFQKKHKKRQIFVTFFLTPPFFRPETDKLPKKSHRPSQMTKMLTKKILVTLEQKLTKKIHNLEPPPIDPYRGVVFEIKFFQKSKKIKKLFFSKTKLNPLRKKFSIFLKK